MVPRNNSKRIRTKSTNESNHILTCSPTSPSGENEVTSPKDTKTFTSEKRFHEGGCIDNNTSRATSNEAKRNVGIHDTTAGILLIHQPQPHPNLWSDSANLPRTWPPRQSTFQDMVGYLPCMRPPAKHVSRCVRPSAYMLTLQGAGRQPNTCQQVLGYCVLTLLQVAQACLRAHTSTSTSTRMSVVRTLVSTIQAKDGECLRSSPGHVHIAFAAPVKRQWSG